MFDSGTLITFESWKDKNPLAVMSPHDPKATKCQVEECKKWKLRLCYNIGQQINNLPSADMREGVEAAEILILNDYELAALCQKTGLSADEIKSTVPVVVTTFGKEGSIVEGAKVKQAIPVGVAKPKQVADPTGAGDAYRAGFLYGYARDWPLKACAQLGAVCATYAIETAGPQGHTFTVDEITKRYEATFKEQLPSKLTKE